MTDRRPGAPGQYTMTISAEEAQKLLAGGAVTITLARNDQPLVEGTPYNKASVLPDDLAAQICPNVADPTPADAFRGLLPKNGGTMAGSIGMAGFGITDLKEPVKDEDAATLKTVKTQTEEISKKIGAKRIWENSSPNVSFSGKTVSIEGLSNYTVKIVEFKKGTDDSEIMPFLIATDGLVYAASITGSGYTITRTVKTSGDNVVFSNASYGSGERNEYLIPINIYGLR